MTPESYGEFLRAYLAEGTRLHHPGLPGPPDRLARLSRRARRLRPRRGQQPDGDLRDGRLGGDGRVRGPALDARQGRVRRGGRRRAHPRRLAGQPHRPAGRAGGRRAGRVDRGVPGDLALLAPASAHYSLTRAAAILGLGERAVMPLDVDGLGRIDVARLPDALDRVRRAGRRPMALVANAGSTGTGLYDDLRGIGEFCADNGVWFHVDGAHGASALLSEEHRHLLDGIELADSLIWDAHKMLRTSSLAARRSWSRREARPGRGLPAAGQLPVLRRPGLRPDRQDRGVQQGRAGPEDLPQPGLAGRAGPGRPRRAASTPPRTASGSWLASGPVSTARTSRRATSSASGTAPATRRGSASA